MTTLKYRLMLLVRALRVYQWTKNLLVLAALIFAQELTAPGQLLRSLAAFAAFCCAASAAYLFNDILDIEKDRAHPEKCRRPLPAGEITVSTAVLIATLLFSAAVAIALSLNFRFFAALIAYTALTVSYSLALKHIIIIDVMAVALGFVVRALAGAVAIDVRFSNWLIVCTLFLALFLALSKRRHEILLLEAGARNHRAVLIKYSVPFLDQLILIVAGAALITYTIYTCSPEVVDKFGTDKLYITIPFVVYGLFRYLYLVHRKAEGGDPGSTLLQDLPLAINVIFWGISCILIIYL
jgi:4-hydroxybenzoate polyprenyltransferase